MHADDRALFPMNQHLAQAVRALILRHKAPRIAHGQLLHLIIDAFFPGLFLRSPDGRDLGAGVNDGGICVITHAVRLAQHCVNGDLCFTISRMRQHMMAVDIARGIHAGHVRAPHRICNDARFLNFHAEGFQSKSGKICPPSDGQEQLVRLDSRRFAIRRFHNGRAVLHREALVLQQKFSASLFQLALKQRAYLAIGGSGDVIQHFDYRHLRARHGVIRRHFQTDHAAAHHDQPVGNFGQLQHLAVGQYEASQIFPHPRNGRHNRRRPAGDQKPLPEIDFAACGHAKAVAVAPVELRLLHYNGHTRRAQLGFYAVYQRAYHATAPHSHRLLIQPNLAAMHAILRAVQRVLVQLGRIEQRLRRDAAFVQAHAAKGSSFKQYHAHTFARRALRSQIPGRAAADHHQIKPLRHIITSIPLIRVNCF